MLMNIDTTEIGIIILASGSLKKSVHPPWASHKEEEDLASKDIITINQSFEELKGFQIFGNIGLLDPIASQKIYQWKPCYMYA